MKHLNHPYPGHFNDAKITHFCSFVPSSLLCKGGRLIIPFFLSKIAGALTTWATYSIESLIKASSWFLFSKHIYSLAIMFIFRTCGRCIRKMDHHCPWFVHYTECTLQFNRLSISVYEFQLIYFILYRSSHDQSL